MNTMSTDSTAGNALDVRSLGLLLAVVLVVLFPLRASALCGVSATNIDFGDYDVFSPSPTDSTGSVTIVCDETPPPAVTILLSPSANSGGFNPRQMKDLLGSDLLNYNIYTKSNMSMIWGDGTSGTDTVSKRVNRNNPWVETLYLRIPAGQNVPAGPYGDNITITIMW